MKLDSLQLSSLYTHYTRVMNNKSSLWSVTCVCVESGFILVKKIVHLAVPSYRGIVIIVSTTQHVFRSIFNAQKSLNLSFVPHYPARRSWLERPTCTPLGPRKELFGCKESFRLLINVTDSCSENRFEPK